MDYYDCTLLGLSVYLLLLVSASNFAPITCAMKRLYILHNKTMRSIRKYKINSIICVDSGNVFCNTAELPCTQRAKYKAYKNSVDLLDFN